MKPEVYESLLKPLASQRVATRKQGNMSLSYLEAWDVKAHLIRFFGFGGWSSEVLEAELVFEEKNEKGQWQVGYKVILALTIHGLEDEDGCWATYTEAAVGSAIGSRADAHDNAVKTAESDALKRCAINLGTQFGLSLYNKGSRVDVVEFTHHAPDGWAAQEAPDESSPTDAEWIASLPAWLDEVKSAATRDELREVWDSCAHALEVTVDDSGLTLRDVILARLNEIDGEELP
jgi:hypothetical protein